MKRYLIQFSSVTFDTRPQILAQEINPEWDDEVRSMWERNKQQIIQGLIQQYGSLKIELKVNNFLQLGREPFSIIAYHNRFLQQSRNAFICGNYYPALTGACALGERILNHLVLHLRDYHKGSKYYKRVYDKKSFDNWDITIEALDEWQVFVSEEVFSAWKSFAIKRLKQHEDISVLNSASSVAELFGKLCDIRNASLHFRIDLDFEDREPALCALHLLQDIIAIQFGIEGPLPWFIPGARGSHFIKKEFENTPFIKEFYLPACELVGPNYKVKQAENSLELEINDPEMYDDVEISDEQFAELLNKSRQ